ncbi:MAG: glycerol-3-phosphate 1-O-acyltransferase PlsY [Clostridia bacterium]
MNLVFLVLKLLAVAAIGYLLGSINTSIIVGKFFGIDIRKHGSGNAGATNTLRTLGAKPAIFTFGGDALKGVIACLLGRLIFGWTIDPSINQGMQGMFYETAETGLLVAGLFAILGHNWPIYFGFKGGKGVLTSFAVLLMMDWRIALILLGVFLAITALTRYVSLGSIIAAFLYPFFTLIPVFGHEGWQFLLASSIVAAIIIFRHGANIGRLIQGKESKVFSKKKEPNALKNKGTRR